MGHLFGGNDFDCRTRRRGSKVPSEGRSDSDSGEGDPIATREMVIAGVDASRGTTAVAQRPPCAVAEHQHQRAFKV